MKVLEIKEVCKSYDKFKAVDKVSFDVEKGSIFGLLGPNGAGKSSTMRMIMNITVPDSGSIELFGKKFSNYLKDKVGYLPEERGLYAKMRVIDHLKFLGELKGMSRTDAGISASKWLQRIGMEEWKLKKINELSKGMAQKIQFIGTIIHNPELIIMDEPFSGLDPVNSKFLKDILLELKKEGKAIILSTHLMENAEKLCDQICLINKGKAVLKGTLRDIKTEYSENSVLLDYEGDLQNITNIDGVKSTNDFGNHVEILLKDDFNKKHFFKALANTDIIINRYEASETSLNDIFIKVVSGGNDE